MSRPQQILDLDPANELVFKGPFSGVVTTTLTLRNPSNEQVGFKVKTTAPKQYCVRPNSGIVGPNSEAVVSVMLQPTEESSDRSKHKFMVQSLCLEEAVSLDDLDATMKSAGKNRLMDSKLKCVFETEDNQQKQQVVSSSSEESAPVPFGGSKAATNSTSDSETASINTQEVSVEESASSNPSSQPTAGSTPSHSSHISAQPYQKELNESEARMFRERLKTLQDENKSLKSETERLKQQFLTRTTTVTKQRPSNPDQKGQTQPFSLVAVLLILIAVVLGYFVGAYTS